LLLTQKRGFVITRILGEKIAHSVLLDWPSPEKKDHEGQSRHIDGEMDEILEEIGYGT